jgi:hypothetical protein
MGYYMGDFYRSARQTRGDPGFFSFLGNVAKTVGGFIPGVGPLIEKAGGALATIGAKRAPQLLTSGVKAVGGAIVKHPGITAAGTAAVGLGVGALAGHALTRRGGVGGKRHRRMNPCNGRALRRAIRRAHAFERLAKKVIGFSSPRKPKGHMYFKRRKKK